MQASRRVFFNPTSLPSLRTPRAQRRDLYDTRQTTGGGLGGWRNDRARLGRGIRRESTETGEDKTGHISASPNEGILFFDSKSVAMFPFKHVSLNLSI